MKAYILIKTKELLSGGGPQALNCLIFKPRRNDSKPDWLTTGAYNVISVPFCL